MRRVNRRLLTILMPLAATTLAAGCTTFETDAVARVGDEALSVDELDELLLGIGATPDDLDEPLPLVAVRDAITAWILERAGEAVDAGDVDATVSPELATRLYDTGIEASGIACPSLMLTATPDLADEAADRLNGGEAFADVFTELNTEPSLQATGGINGCFALAQLGPDVEATPDGAALYAVNSDDPATSASIVGPDGSDVGFVVAFRPFDELTPEEQTQVLTTAEQIIGPRLLLEDLDISVDPRYGAFDPTTTSVIAIG